MSAHESGRGKVSRIIQHYLMRVASWLPLSLLLKIDHLDWWKRDEAEFSFWTDAHYWQYCRQNKKKRNNDT